MRHRRRKSCDIIRSLFVSPLTGCLYAICCMPHDLNIKIHNSSSKKLPKILRLVISIDMTRLFINTLFLHILSFGLIRTNPEYLIAQTQVYPLSSGHLVETSNVVEYVDRYSTFKFIIEIKSVVFSNFIKKKLMNMNSAECELGGNYEGRTTMHE